MSRHRSKLPPFVPLLRETLDSAAWGAMSHGARSLYVALKRRYNSDFHNNGKIYLSLRDASQEIGSGREEIVRWFRELQHYGFIVLTQAGYLGLDGKGKAPHWRLTECGYMKDPPTRDFMKWDGVKFKHPRRAARSKTESRTAKAVQGGTERRSTPGTERRSTNGNKWTAKAVHSEAQTGTERRSITSIPLHAQAEPEQPLPKHQDQHRYELVPNYADLPTYHGCQTAHRYEISTDAIALTQYATASLSLPVGTNLLQDCMNKDDATLQREWDLYCEWRNRVRAFTETRTWPDGFGPAPGCPGCRAPATLLRVYGFDRRDRGDVQ